MPSPRVKSMSSHEAEEENMRQDFKVDDTLGHRWQWIRDCSSNSFHCM